MISHDQVIRAFVDKLAEHGITLSDPSRIELDGQWHRAHVDGDRGRAENLSYKIWFDDRPGGWFEDHKRGVTGSFSTSNGESMDPAEREAAQARWRAAQAARAAEQEQSYLEAAKRAQRALQAATGDPQSHPYIQRKGITKGAGVKVDSAGLLLIPVYTDFGVLSSYQSISADGDKLFMPSGRMSGAFHPIIGSNKACVLVCEGYATGAALVQATGYSVACAMSAGNLAAVVKKMQAKFPEREIVACPDNDHGTEARTGKNPGLEAAQDLGVRALAPNFPDGADPSHTDWDDWLRGYGTAEQLRELLDLSDAPTAPADAPAVSHETPPQIEVMPRLRADLDAVDDEDAPLPAKYTEMNASLAFARRFEENLRYVDDWGRWMAWNGARWQQDRLRHAMEMSKRLCTAVAEHARADGSITPKQQDAVSNRYGEKRTIMNVADLAKSDTRIAATTDQWDADQWLLNTPGGVVDLRTGRTRPGDRADYMTKMTRVSPGGACPLWRAFLDTATAGDKPLQDFLQRLCGYTLTGEVREQILVFVYGPGGNGKGTFLNTLHWILGDYSTPASMDVFTERKHESHPTELAGLMGARLVTAQETEEGKRWNESRIKALTGGDPIKARFMRQDEFEFMPQFQLIIAGNHKPGLRNVDEAIKRRMRLVPFDVTIPAERRDPMLADRLRVEAGGILAWAIEGCQLWQRDGLQAPPRVLAATEEYLEQQDSIGAWIDECCEQGNGHTSRRGDLYKSFKAWAERTGEFPLPQKRWVAAIETRGIRARVSNGIAICDGLKVKQTSTSQFDGRWDAFD